MTTEEHLDQMGASEQGVEAAVEAWERTEAARAEWAGKVRVGVAWERVVAAIKVLEVEKLAVEREKAERVKATENESDCPRWLQALGVTDLYLSEGTHGPGFFYPDTREIEVSKYLTPLSRHEVFLHELLHALHRDWPQELVSDEVLQTLCLLEIPFELDLSGGIKVEYDYPEE